jgi:hypothetical protein
MGLLTYSLKHNFFFFFTREWVQLRKAYEESPENPCWDPPAPGAALESKDEHTGDASTTLVWTKNTAAPTTALEVTNAGVS